MDVQTEVVLGGSGFIGKHLVEALRRRGANVQNYDLKNGYDLRLVPPPTPTNHCYIWFLAWEVGGSKFLFEERNQTEILWSNLALCQTIFPWIAENGFESTFVGTQMAGYNNAYGLTKLIGEYWASLTPGCVVAKLWNIYGLEDASERSHVITDLVRSGQNGHIRCLSSGTERRQFLYVKDCVTALLHQRETRQPVADITSGIWTSIRTLSEILAQEMDVSATFGESPGYESIVEPKQHLAEWEATYSLNGGIRDMLNDAKIRKPN